MKKIFNLVEAYYVRTSHILTAHLLRLLLLYSQQCWLKLNVGPRGALGKFRVRFLISPTGQGVSEHLVVQLLGS